MDLTKFRTDNGLRQADVAEYLGVRVSFITNIECGRNRLPDARRQVLLDNDRGWDTSALQEVDDSSPVARKTDEVARLRAQVKELQERCDRYWALIEKLTSK